jgi:HK97 gp10 family phage protein
VADNRFSRKQIVLDRMRKIPAAVRVEARRALDAEAQSLVDDIRPNVPVDDGPGGGELRDSLEWHRSPRGDRIAVVVTEGLNQQGDPTNRKARAVEHGRADMEAQPHFYPTYRATKRKRRNRVFRRVRDVIRSIWGKGS